MPQPNQYTVKKDSKLEEAAVAEAEYRKDKEEEEEEENKDSNKKTDEKISNEKASKKVTIIPLSGSKQEYEKAGIEYPRIQADVERESFERQTKGKWTREVRAIIYYRDVNDNEYLDWNETRHGKTEMGRQLDKTFSHVPQRIVPVASQEIQYDPETDENKLINTGKEKEQTLIPGIKFSKEALDELVEDVSKRQCEYIIAQEAGRHYTVSKKELLKHAGNFEKLYNLKASIKPDND